MQNLLEVKKLVVQIRYVLTPQQKIKAMGVAMVILFGSLLELLGVTAVMPFIQAMLEPDKLRNNVLFQHMFSLLQINSSRNMVWVCGILLVFLYLFKNGLREHRRSCPPGCWFLICLSRTYFSPV